MKTSERLKLVTHPIVSTFMRGKAITKEAENKNR